MRPSRLPLAGALALTAAACASGHPTRGFPGPELPPSHAETVFAPNVPGLPGFSAAVKSGFTVYASGQVPLDSASRLVGPGDLGAQAQQAFANLADVIRAARGVPADLVKLTVYVVGYDTSAVRIIRQAGEPYFEPRVPPALTIVGVAALPEQGMLVAVDGVAVLHGQLPDRDRDRHAGGGR
jgi:enamine deaminase RidA (YjgF/YER057c/UK114 family)